MGRLLSSREWSCWPRQLETIGNYRLSFEDEIWSIGKESGRRRGDGEGRLILSEEGRQCSVWTRERQLAQETERCIQ